MAARWSLDTAVLLPALIALQYCCCLFKFDATQCLSPAVSCRRSGLIARFTHTNPCMFFCAAVFSCPVALGIESNRVGSAREDLPESFAQRHDGVDPATPGVAGRDAPVRAHGGSSDQGKLRSRLGLTDDGVRVEQG